MHFDKSHMIYKYPLITIIIKINNALLSSPHLLSPGRRPTSSREAGAFQGAGREAGGSWVMMWVLMTHSGTVSRRAAEVKKGNQSVKMAGHGLELGQAGTGAGASLLGKTGKEGGMGKFSTVWIL